MTNELNDLVPAQEKLEWITPKISLMVAEDTEGKFAYIRNEACVSEFQCKNPFTAPS
jgi:hypothetical protein